MNRGIVIGALCLGVGMFLGLAVGSMSLGVNRLFGASANALAGSAYAPEMSKEAAFPGAPPAPAEEALAGGEIGAVVSGLGGGGKGYGRGGALMRKSMVSFGEVTVEGGVVEGVVEGVVGGILGVAEEPAPSRAWFPETFLFEPLVVTDGEGAASVPVKVPDRLTRWRVLALAHSRQGAQAGAVATLEGTLPTYVDPVLPPFLRAGDTVRLPVQVVNTTEAAVRRALAVTAEGAVVEGGARTVEVPAHGSVVEYVTVRAGKPGPVTVTASLGGADAVVRGFDVWPTGRPVTQTWGGTLAAPRTLTLEGAADALGGSERVRLLVYPGALGLLRAELSGAVGRAGVAEDAYALLLAGRAPDLLKALGEGVDEEALKRMASVTGQRVLRAGRAPDVATAALLAEAALAHPGNAVLARLGERLAGQVAAAQRPDGTCQGGDGWTLQRLLVATADCARAVRAAAGTPEGQRRAAAFSARASGAFERYVGRVQDAYTAAALVASGAVTGTVADTLRQRVREALKKREDGSAWLPVEEGVERADGMAPSEAEATALAVLALAGDNEAPLADLGTSVLAGYRPWGAWGDGRANRVGLEAALALFKQPLPAQVRVVLARDGKVVTEGTLDAKALREVLALEADATGSAGKHTWVVRAEPAVPGLGFSLSLGAYVPWKAEAAQGGMELAVKVPGEVKVGMPVEVVVQAAAPTGVAMTLRQGLPAGAQADRASLDVLVREGKLAGYDVEDGAVSLRLPARTGPETFNARFRVVPTLAGTLQAGESSLTPEGRPELAWHVPPATWTVR